MQNPSKIIYKKIKEKARRKALLHHLYAAEINEIKLPYISGQDFALEDNIAYLQIHDNYRLDLRTLLVAVNEMKQLRDQITSSKDMRNAIRETYYMFVDTRPVERVGMLRKLFYAYIKDVEREGVKMENKEIILNEILRNDKKLTVHLLQFSMARRVKHARDLLKTQAIYASTSPYKVNRYASDDIAQLQRTSDFIDWKLKKLHQTEAHWKKNEKSLYKRLGGVFAIAAVVEYFSDNIMKNPMVGRDSSNPLLREWSRQKAPTRLAGLKFMRTLWVCDITGGPFKFHGSSSGKSTCPFGKGKLNLKNAHCDLEISSAEFDEVADELSKSLDHFKVPKKEKNQVLAAFAAHKPEVIV